MKQLTHIRPKLKENALFLQTESGLFVIRDGPGFHMKGKTIARWIAALRPHLNGEQTLEQILARLEPAQREYATQIVSVLLQKEVLKDNEPEEKGLLDDAVVEHFQEQIEYIDHFVDAPHAHFKRFRERSLLLYGSGEALRSLALFLLRNGLRELTMVVTDEITSYRNALAHDVDVLQNKQIEARITITTHTSSEQALPLDDHDTIVYCADHGSLAEIARLNQQCVESGRAFIALTPIANTGRLMLGPFVEAGHGPCWLCAILRLSNNSEDRIQAALWREMTVPTTDTMASPLYSPLARRIGHGLGFELFKTFSGCLSSETERGVIIQDMTTLESTYSPLVRHPYCPVCSHGSEADEVERLMQVVTGRKDQLPTQQELYQQHERLFSQDTGLFTRFLNEEIEQVPLKRAQITAGDDTFKGGRKDVIAFSLDTPFAAQMQALQLAIGIYSRQNIAAHIHASTHTLRERGERVIMPQELTTWAGFTPLDEQTPTGWMPAFSPIHKDVVYVPAAALSAQFNQQRFFEHTEAGMAVATTYADLLEQGTLSALLYEYQQQAYYGQGVSQAVDAEQIATDEDLHFLLASARRFDESVTLGLMKTTLPIYVAIARTQKHTRGSMGIGLESRDALLSALQKLVESFQIQQDSEPRIEDIDARLNTLALVEETGKADLQTTTHGDFAQLIQALQIDGRDILFVHTTSADIWEEGSLMSGHVLLTRSVSRQQEG